MTRTRPLALVLLTTTSIFLPPALWAADPAAGAAAWRTTHPQADGAAPRSCVTCHGSDLTQAGRQANTGKRIEPMAPSVTPSRLTDPAKVEKWLTRNCRWTLGRDCTVAEKADFIAYIQAQ